MKCCELRSHGGSGAAAVGARFRHVIDWLKRAFHLVCASCDGFDETEDAVFPDMLAERGKNERFIHSSSGPAQRRACWQPRDCTASS